MTVDCGGTVTLSGANTFTGGTMIAAGTLELASANAAGGAGDGVADAYPTPLQKSGAMLAVQFLDGGDARGALAAASGACHEAPHLAEPHYVYGQAWMALGQSGLAERAFAEAVRLKPDWADAWVNYGVARYRQGSVEDAKAAMRQALLRAPNHAAATANLGAFMRISGEAEAAEALLDAAVARDPSAVGARLNRAADLLQEERSEEALALLGVAPPPAEPLAARYWHLQRSLALLQLGRLAEVRATLDALDALGPSPAAFTPLRLWRDVLLAQAEGDPDSADAAAVAMSATLDAMGPEAVPEHRIMGHYNLAKFRSGRGEHAAAFAHWTAAHRLMAPGEPFSRAAHAAFIDANIRAFPAARFAEGPRASNRDPAPVFIVGMPRSGTTLCEQILAAHRDVHGAGERATLGRIFAALGGGREDTRAPARIAAVDAPALDRTAEAYLAELHALAPEAKRVVDKMPANALHLGLVGMMLPSAKVIHCRRDPRDTGLSIFTFRFHGDHGYAHDLSDLGWTIRQRERLMEHWEGALPGGVHTVDLADWVADFDGTLARLLAFLDLPPDPVCARFYEAETRVRTVSRAQVRQPVNARGLGRWRTYEAELAPLIAALASAAA